MEDSNKILYKYRVWENQNHKRILTENELFFATADSFNDPFDASLPFMYDRSEMTEENIKKKLFETGKRSFPQYSEQELKNLVLERIKVGGFDSDEYWKSQFSTHKEIIKTHFGICSFTSKNDNLLMWAHYANSHKGICIGFEFNELVSHGSSYRVSYTDSFPTMPLFSNDRTQDYPRLFTTKSKDWEYEDEYRIIRAIGFDGITHESRKCVKLKGGTIKEIILGCRIDPESKNEIINLVQKRRLMIRLYDSIMNDTEFKINLVEIT